MALQKTITTAYGVDLNYWKVTRLNIDWHNKVAEVFLGGWPQQATRLQGTEALEYRSQVFRHDDWPFTFDGNNVSEAYDRLKQPIEVMQTPSQPPFDTNPFTNATDVI